MGYTHYWYLREDVHRTLEVSTISEDLKALLPHLPPLAGPLGKGLPVIGAEIAFNGPEPDDYESFIFPGDFYPSEVRQGWSFACCKTEHRPYDRAVQVTLLLAKLHLGEAIRLSTDGTLAEWVEAAQLIERHLLLPVDLYWALGYRLWDAQDVGGRRFLVEARDEEEAFKYLKKLPEYLRHAEGVGLRVPTLEAPFQMLKERRLPQEELKRLKGKGFFGVYLL
jgi:hypothetical protein